MGMFALLSFGTMPGALQRPLSNVGTCDAEVSWSFPGTEHAPLIAPVKPAKWLPADGTKSLPFESDFGTVQGQLVGKITLLS